MNNVWTVVLFVIVAALLAYFLGQVWFGFGIVGWIAVFALPIIYLFKRWKRIQ